MDVEGEKQVNQCPIIYYEENLVFNIDKSVWAVYRLQGYDYDFLDIASKLAVLNRVTRLLCGIMSDAQILIVPVEQNNKEHFRKIRKRLRKSDPLYDAAYSHAMGTEVYLERLSSGAKDVNDYAFYMIGKLSDNNEYEILNGLKESYQFFVKNPINALNVLMNTDTYDILESKIEETSMLSQKWFSSQNKKIELSKVTGEELQWLFRRAAFRGLSTSANLFYSNSNYDTWYPTANNFTIGDEKVIKPYRKDIANLFAGTIRSKGRVLEIEHDNVTSYQTFLVITNIPDSVEYPGCEWIYMLQQYNVQAEVCLHIRAVEHRESLRKLDQKKQELDSQIGNIEEAGARIPEDLSDGIEYADEMEAELKALKAPILYTTISICLSADNKEELEQNVITIRNAYEDMQFVVERPFSDQYKLYLNHIPSVGNNTKDYVMPITPMTLAAGVIGAVHELGDKEGPYIGTTGVERKQVFLSLARACLMNKSAAATFYGNLGYGKSFNANLLLVLMVLYGGYGLIFDPKGERSHWESEFTLLEGLITSISLAAEPEYAGKLDPYIMYRNNIDMANELALNVLSEILKISPTSGEYTVLLEAAKCMKAEFRKGRRKLSMLFFCEILKNFNRKDELCKIAQALARRIELQREVGMSMLLFGTGEEDAIMLDNRLNIIMIQNLKLPSPETPKEAYTSEELLSTVIMMVVGQFAKQFAMVKRPVFKCILFDESWALGRTTEGVKLYDFLTRMGRSLYSGVILNGHSVLDLPTEGIKNTISYKFCFHTDNDAEADRMCKYLGIASTVENKESLMNLRNAQCMFRDLDGHVGILEFDAVFQDLIDVFSTTPVILNQEEIEKENAAYEENQEKEKENETEESTAEEMEEIQDESDDFMKFLFEKEVLDE